MEDDSKEMQERLDKVEEQIQEARDDTRDLLPKDEDDEELYEESGSIHPELDDQTITPPG
jgi:hypothetical protein